MVLPMQDRPERALEPRVNGLNVARCGPVDVALDQLRGVVHRAGHQMVVPIPRDRHRSVAHRRRDGPDVDAGRDRDAGEGMAALVRRDPGQLGGLPCFVGAGLELLGIERQGRRPAEQEVRAATAGAEPVRREDRPQSRMIGTTRRSRPFVGCSPSMESQPATTWISPASRSTAWSRRAISSPRRSPA
jgi:hypothetical protein